MKLCSFSYTHPGLFLSLSLSLAILLLPDNTHIIHFSNFDTAYIFTLYVMCVCGGGGLLLSTCTVLVNDITLHIKY